MDGERRGEAVFRVVDRSEIFLNLDQAVRRIRSATGASGAGDFTVGESIVAFGQAFAGDPKTMTNWLEGEEAKRAGLDAVVASDALVFIDKRKAVLVHSNGIEVAGNFAIREAQATPSTSFTTAASGSCSSARLHAAVLGTHSGHVVSTGAGKASDDLFLVAQFDSKKIRDIGRHFRRAYGAFRRVRAACDACFRKGSAARATACSAIGGREKFLNFIDSRILLDV